MRLSEDELLQKVARARLGDRDAFGDIYEIFYKDMYRFALYMLKNENDAADAVSEATLDAFKGIGGLKDDTKIKQWLFAIVSAKCKRKLGDYAKSGVDIDELPELEAPQDVDTADKLAVRQAIEQLEAIDRHIVIMHVVEGFTTREIAEELEMNENTVRTRHKRALERMRVWLGG